MSYRKMIWFFQAAVLAAALLAGGCGNGEDEDPSYSQPELVDGDLPSYEAGEGEEAGPEGPVQRLEDIKIGGGAPLMKTTKNDPLTCEFKKDHIMDGLSLSGRSLLLKNKANAARLIPYIFQKNNKGGLFGWRKNLIYRSKDRIFSKEQLLIRPFTYNRKSKYKSWCPEGEGDCLVHVVFQGVVYEPRGWKTRSYEGYLFKGPLLISVVFNGELLNFSSCPEKEKEKEGRKAKRG